MVTRKDFTDSKARTTLKSVINGTTGKAQYLSFEWSQFRISSTDSKARTTLQSIINSTTGKYHSAALSFEWSHPLKNFIHRTKS